MSAENKVIRQDLQTSRNDASFGSPILNTIQYPGLSSGAKEIGRLTEDLPKRLAAFFYKKSMPCLWIIFSGGTGTGKSTLFNAFCGRPLSDTGVERPKTCGPVVYAHKESPVEKGFPFPCVKIERHSLDSSYTGQTTGMPGHLLILEHNLKNWSHIIVVDTPDLDSIEAPNRRIAEDLYLLADVVVFVTSQEKYADEMPYHLLKRAIRERKPYFFVLNKVHDRFTREEILEALQVYEVSLSNDRMWFIPYAPSLLSQRIPRHPAFNDFKMEFFRHIPLNEIESFRKAQHSRRSDILKVQVNRLIELLKAENRATRKWLEELDALCQSTSQDLVKDQIERFTIESQKYLRMEIRRLFNKYDVLAKPRRFIQKIFLTPLRLIGITWASPKDSGKEALLKVQRKIDLAPIQTAIEKMNMLVLERLSPKDETSPLFNKLRETDVILNDKEIKEFILKEQERIATWLAEIFKKLSEGIPKTKKWGIYSTSLLWGILILSFETVVGGGFTVLDAALDSALAPFVTKGAVELFAYKEIQKIARELAKRYQEGLVSVVVHQRQRYEDCLQSLITPVESLEELRQSLI